MHRWLLGSAMAALLTLFAARTVLAQHGAAGSESYTAPTRALAAGGGTLGSTTFAAETAVGVPIGGGASSSGSFTAISGVALVDGEIQGDVPMVFGTSPATADKAGGDAIPSPRRSLPLVRAKRSD